MPRGYYTSSSDDSEGWASCLGIIICGLLLFGGWFWFSLQSQAMGINGFGPERQYDVTIVSKHIDAQKDSSSYMVVGDTQTFEVDNGTLLGMWNADEVYGKIVVGQRYCITAKGNQVTSWWWQQYPYILKSKPGGC